jgi:hypothetical protein
VLPVYVVVAIPPSLVGLAAVLAVIRADRKDLPTIVRALMRWGIVTMMTRMIRPPSRRPSAPCFV